jgi:hypothetical protein
MKFTSNRSIWAVSDSVAFVAPFSVAVGTGRNSENLCFLCLLLFVSMEQEQTEETERLRESFQRRLVLQKWQGGSSMECDSTILHFKTERN